MHALMHPKYGSKSPGNPAGYFCAGLLFPKKKKKKKKKKGRNKELFPLLLYFRPDKKSHTLLLCLSYCAKFSLQGEELKSMQSD